MIASFPTGAVIQTAVAVAHGIAMAALSIVYITVLKVQLSDTDIRCNSLCWYQVRFFIILILILALMDGTA